MKYIFMNSALVIIGIFALLGNAFALTEAEANKAYKQAVEKYKHQAQAKKTAVEAEKKATEKPPVINIVDDSVSLPDHTDPNYTAGKTATEVDISDLKLTIDVEDMPLSEVLDYVISKVEAKSGNYDVKWRLKAENSDIKNQRVNLIAEASFGEFVNYLTERVKNMTGIQLFVTVFKRSRIIMITDTYY